jgi:signal transduction histidine kinase
MSDTVPVIDLDRWRHGSPTDASDVLAEVRGALERSGFLVVVNHGIDPALAAVLPGVLAHLVRNAIAHGIETPSARVEAGKPAVGVVTLSCGQGSRITVRDDGRGVAPQIAGRIFEAGTTTRAEVDRLSGRGVGLSAVAAELAEAGYAIATEPAAIGASFVVRPRI